MMIRSGLFYACMLGVGVLLALLFEPVTRILQQINNGMLFAQPCCTCADLRIDIGGEGRGTAGYLRFDPSRFTFTEPILLRYRGDHDYPAEGGWLHFGGPAPLVGYTYGDTPAPALGDPDAGVYRSGPGCTRVGDNTPYSIECEPEQLVCED